MDSFSSVDRLLFGSPSFSDCDTDSPLILSTPDGLITPQPFESPLSPIRTRTPLTHTTPRTPLCLRTPIPQPFQTSLSPIKPRTPQTHNRTPRIYISPNQTPSCFVMKELNESPSPFTPPTTHSKPKNTTTKRKLLEYYEPTDPRGVCFLIPSPKRTKHTTPKPLTPTVYECPTTTTYSPYIPEPFLMFPDLKYVDEVEKKDLDFDVDDEMILNEIL